MSVGDTWVTCPACGKRTIKKKRCMYCWSRLPVEEQGELGGTGLPYWIREAAND